MPATPDRRFGPVVPIRANGDTEVARGQLRIRERRTDSGSIPIEGAYQCVSVRRTSDDRVVYRDRSSTGPVGVFERTPRLLPSVVVDRHLLGHVRNARPAL